jgi:hypothetical protein
VGDSPVIRTRDKGHSHWATEKTRGRRASAIALRGFSGSLSQGRARKTPRNRGKRSGWRRVCTGESRRDRPVGGAAVFREPVSRLASPFNRERTGNSPGSRAFRARVGPESRLKPPHYRAIRAATRDGRDRPSRRPLDGKWLSAWRTVARGPIRFRFARSRHTAGVPVEMVPTSASRLSPLRSVASRACRIPLATNRA